ncbi:hypothetical protein [Noviherbaspirillum sp.]|uniref:hypothetical protein n=1 Tax=Noviherbaspirillum sp. TaxID=1926288 RepID=UPI002D48BE9E|nr:hypothetical protein [Noviherbaspirillum sp.]HZW19729.1 hypothetical protein [Noviherbaspirillum sp.]
MSRIEQKLLFVRARISLRLIFDLVLMDPKIPFKGVARPWILGSYAVYAHNLHAARLVYEYARQSDPGPFGTVELETGEAIDWNNMNYGVGDHHG